MRWFVAFITLITLALTPVFADVRADAKKYLAREWRSHPEHCLEALRLVVEADRRKDALQELERELPNLHRPACDKVTPAVLAAQILSIYNEAFKFNDPTGKTDDLWEMVAKSALEPVVPCAADGGNDQEIGNELACLNSYIYMKNTVYSGGIPTLEGVSQLYGQKLYLNAIYRLLHEVDAGDNNPFRLANYRTCYAVPADSGKYELFELVQTVLGK
jgi:hypothetical protein